MGCSFNRSSYEDRWIASARTYFPSYVNLRTLACLLTGFFYGSSKDLVDRAKVSFSGVSEITLMSAFGGIADLSERLTLGVLGHSF